MPISPHTLREVARVSAAVDQAICQVRDTREQVARTRAEFRRLRDEARRLRAAKPRPAG